MDQVVKCPVYIYLSNRFGFSLRPVRAQSGVDVGLEMFHVRDVVLGSKLRCLAINCTVAKTIGENMWETEAIDTVLVVIPIVELAGGQPRLGLHSNLEKSRDRHVE